jgi:hypothetical protein
MDMPIIIEGSGELMCKSLGLSLSFNRPVT